MFEVLNDCFFKSLEQSHTPSKSVPSNPGSSQEHDNALPKLTPKRSIDQDQYTTPTNLPDLDAFKYMTLAEAAKQHKMVDKNNKIIGDVKTAYKCFEEHANNNQTNASNQIKAKYYKACYISREIVDLNINSQESDKIVAQLFKEVADDEKNEFPEAKVRYGDCLYNGKGVEQDLAKALEYFEKAAEDGFKVAMYNTGNLCWNGIAGTKDIEKATRYMKLAAYNNYEPAIKFCKEHNIAL
jgi:TPR repeat protein